MTTKESDASGGLIIGLVPRRGALDLIGPRHATSGRS